MSKKRSIFGRITQMAKANANAAIDAAEDPGKMLDQTIREYNENIQEAESAVATTIGNLRLLEDDQQEDERAAVEWGKKAAAAIARSQQFQEAGDEANATKFESLAKVALGKQVAAENEAKAQQAQVASQSSTVEQLKTGLEKMKAKRTDLVSKRDELVARNRNATAQNQMMDAVKSIDFLDPSSEVGRFEEKIRREEARAIGAGELMASTLDNQFDELDDLGEVSEVEARLAALKGGTAGQIEA